MGKGRLGHATLPIVGGRATSSALSHATSTTLMIPEAHQSLVGDPFFYAVIEIRGSCHAIIV